MKKKILLAVAAALVIGGVVIYPRLGGFITQTAEKIASNALGVAVDIGSIDVSLSDHKVTVNGLKIGNPEGFTASPHAMTADSIDITLESADHKLIDFKEIAVNGSQVYVEINEHGMNLNALKKQANSSEHKDQVGSEQIRVIIDRMAINPSMVHISSTFLKDAIPPIKLPPVEISGIGKGNNATAGQAVVQVFSHYFSAVEEAVRKQGLMGGLDGVKKKLEGVGDSIKKLF